MSLLDEVQYVNKYNRGEGCIKFKELSLKETTTEYYMRVEKEMILFI